MGKPKKPKMPKLQVPAVEQLPDTSALTDQRRKRRRSNSSAVQTPSLLSGGAGPSGANTSLLGG